MNQAAFIVLNNPTELPSKLRHGIAAIGNFDGVHRGHAAVLQTARQWANERGVTAASLTFEPHPRAYFAPETDFFRLSAWPEKSKLLAQQGLDAAIALRFDAERAAQTADGFIEDLFVHYQIQGIVIGEDFHFGQQRSGNLTTLIEGAKKHGASVKSVAPVLDAGGVISSSRIRKHLEAGEMNAATHLLGHTFCVQGLVIDGEKRGRQLGFPTANIALKNCALRHGIYAVRAHLGDKTYEAVASFGRRPTFDNGAPLLEVYLLKVNQDLYGRELRIEFIEFLRPELHFDSIEALVNQMHKDCQQAAEILEAMLKTT